MSLKISFLIEIGIIKSIILFYHSIFFNNGSLKYLLIIDKLFIYKIFNM